MKIKKKDISDYITEMIYFGDKKVKGKITKKDIEILNDRINELMYGDDDLEESLSDEWSLNYHYGKHVLKQGEVRNAKNVKKYDYMTKEDYYNYAVEVSNLTPDVVIDDSVKDKSVLGDYIDDFINNQYNVVLFDKKDIVNKTTGQPVKLILNRQSKYGRKPDLCIVDKKTGEPVTIFMITLARVVNTFSL